MADQQVQIIEPQQGQYAQPKILGTKDVKDRHRRHHQQGDRGELRLVSAG